MQRIQRLRHRPRAGEWTVIATLRPSRTAMLLDAREGMILPQQDKRKALIIAQQHVVWWPVAFNQLRLQQQRLRLAARGDNVHGPRLRNHPLQAQRQFRRLRIIGDTVFKAPRLPHIQHIAARIHHAIDAGRLRQSFPNPANGGYPRLQIGPLRPAHGIGRRILIKAVGGIGLVRTARFGFGGRRHGADIVLCSRFGQPLPTRTGMIGHFFHAPC